MLSPPRQIVLELFDTDPSWACGEIALVGSIFLRTPSPRGLLGPISPYLANLAYGALIALMGSIF